MAEDGTSSLKEGKGRERRGRGGRGGEGEEGKGRERRGGGGGEGEGEEGKIINQVVKWSLHSVPQKPFIASRKVTHFSIASS